MVGRVGWRRKEWEHPCEHPQQAPAWLLPAWGIISPIVRFLINGRLEWMGSDAFMWPFDGDPLNCCQAARLSRRGWESQVVASGWMGRSRGGEGARDGGC